MSAGQTPTSVYTTSLGLNPTEEFVGVLAELNGQFSGWSDGTHPWADQTGEHCGPRPEAPKMDARLLGTELGQQMLDDVAKLTAALLAGDFMYVRQYISQLRFVMVVGFPRSGGTYVLKELLRLVGLDPARVASALAHDAHPHMQQTWYGGVNEEMGRPVQGGVLPIAEFFSMSRRFYERRTAPQPGGHWLVPKKSHTCVWKAGDFRVLLGGNAEYLVTVRHPLPTALSMAEQSGASASGEFIPDEVPRSNNEVWVLKQLLHLGYDVKPACHMPYIEAVSTAWANYYMTMATSGLFLGDRERIPVVPYGKTPMERAARWYYNQAGSPAPVSPFFVKQYPRQPRAVVKMANEKVEAVANAWGALGLSFPEVKL